MAITPVLTVRELGSIGRLITAQLTNGRSAKVMISAQSRTFCNKIRLLASLDGGQAELIQDAINDGPWPGGVKDILVGEVGSRLIVGQGKGGKSQQHCLSLEHYMTGPFIDQMESQQ